MIGGSHEGPLVVMGGIPVVPVVLALLLVLHVFALLAERRGWIYYRTRPPRVGTLGLLEALVEPEVEHMVEEQSSESLRADPSEWGDGYRHDNGSG